MIRMVDGLTDDSGFLDLLNSLTSALLARFKPHQVWVIHIDNWFDHKWLKFSGNGAIASNFPSMFGLTLYLDSFTSVKTEFYQDKLTFPPFTPNRVLGQWSYTRTFDGYLEQPLPSSPHSHESMQSGSNIHRRIEDRGDSACFIWYGGNTLKNGRGSVMVYELEDDRTHCWFAAFHRHDKWELGATKGVSRSEIKKFIDSAL
jgi:hypothetical protein